MTGDCAVITLLNLETCFACRGAGSVGRQYEWHIICEACGGNGKLFRERAALIREDEWE